MEIKVATSHKAYDLIRLLLIQYDQALDIQLKNFKQELDNLSSKYPNKDGCLLIATYNHQPVGCVGLRKIADNICKMKRLYVQPEYRGTGIGTALAKRIFEEAKKRNYRYIRLDTLLTMTSATLLYR